MKGRLKSNTRSILLMQDDPDDVTLTLRAFKKNNILNEVVVSHDGAEALDYLLGRSAYSGRYTSVLPPLILLDLKPPRMDGPEELHHVRSDEKTELLSVVILASSWEFQDRMNDFKNGCNSYICKLVDFVQSAEAVRQPGLYWPVLNGLPSRER
jgi:CheY-like chemotaxis protein